MENAAGGWDFEEEFFENVKQLLTSTLAIGISGWLIFSFF